jgi:hypothetical protein
MKKAICKSNEKMARDEGEIESLWEMTEYPQTALDGYFIKSGLKMNF